MKKLLIALCLILPVAAYPQFISNGNFTFTPIGLKVDASGSVAISGQVQSVLVDSNGNPVGIGANGLSVSVQNTPSVTVTASALPTGAATQATLFDLDSKVVHVDTNNVTVTAMPAIVISSIPTVTAQMASNLNGSMVNLTTTTTAAQTITAPANAVGFIFESDSTSSGNVRYAVGATASASVGTLMEPGRDSGYIPSGANISVISITDSPTISVQWIQR